MPVHEHGGSGDAGEAGSHEDMDHDETDRQMDADENREPGSAMGKDVTDKFRQDFTGLVRKYLDLKNALFESDNAGAKQAAENFVSSLEAAGKHRMSGEPHMAWMEIYDALYSGAKTIQQSDDLEAMRRNFSSLSQNLAEAAVSLGIGMDLYMQFCPMAFDGKGAYWLSDSEKIENPYLPETMPGCGEVEKNWNLFEIKHRASAGRMRGSPGFVLS